MGHVRGFRPPSGLPEAEGHFPADVADGLAKDLRKLLGEKKADRDCHASQRTEMEALGFAAETLALPQETSTIEFHPWRPDFVVDW